MYTTCLEQPDLEVFDAVDEVAFDLRLDHDVSDRPAPPVVEALRGRVDGGVAAVAAGYRPAAAGGGRAGAPLRAATAAPQLLQETQHKI